MTSTTQAATIPAGSTVIDVICRDAWGAGTIGAGLVGHDIERLTVHHTEAVLADNRKAPSRLRLHERYHRSLGWPDLAYHYAVDRNGHVYEGRPTWARGDTGTSYDPAGHFLVVAEGNFDSQQISDAQLSSVAAVFAWAADRFSVSPATLQGHKDYAPETSCPGANFHPLVTDGTLQTMVEAWLARGGVALNPVCGEEARARVAAIEAGSI